MSDRDLIDEVQNPINHYRSDGNKFISLVLSKSDIRSPNSICVYITLIDHY